MKTYYTLHQSIDTVWKYLTDMEHFVNVHPVITRMEKTGADTYLVFETLPLAFLPFSFTYPVTLTKTPEHKQVYMKATVMKITVIQLHFTLSENNGSTIVEEEIVIKSLLPVTFLMQKILRKHHGQLFKNMENAPPEYLQKMPVLSS